MLGLPDSQRVAFDEIDGRLCPETVDAAPLNLIRLNSTKIRPQILHSKRKAKLIELDTLLHTLARLREVVDLVRLSEELRELQAHQRDVAKHDRN